MLRVLLTTLLLSTSPDPILKTWYIVGGDAASAHFAQRSSLNGPPAHRRLVSELIARTSVAGIKASRFTVEFDCDNRTFVYIDQFMFTASGKLVGTRDHRNDKPAPIRPKTLGDNLWHFACDTNADGPTGFPLMVDIDRAADRFFRLQGVGLTINGSAALAAVDPTRSPQTLRDLLNLFVPAERQDLIEGILEPDAAK